MHHDQARLCVDDFSITDDPFTDDLDSFFLDVAAPMPDGDYGRDGWGVLICRWESDDPEDEDSSSTGEPVLRCTRSASPTAAEIVNLLNRSGGSQEQLAAWAKTSVGETLSDTTFMVTERYDD